MSTPHVNTSDEPLFHEVQRFTQPWLWGLIFGSTGFTWYLALEMMLRGSTMDLLIASLLALGGTFLPCFFLVLKLITEVREDGIYVRFVPFHRRFKRFGFEDLKDITARRYSAILEYGGWGIRLGPRGWAYNVKGPMGVQLVPTSGIRVLIGTQRIDDFMAAIDSAAGEHPNGRTSN